MTTESPLRTPGPALQRIHAAALKLFAERGDTRVSVNDLALAAGVARGTIYNNVREPEALFEELAAQLGAEMLERVTRSFVGIEDPAQRLAQGVRQFVRRAHEEPHWGRFVSRFAFGSKSLHHIWVGQPVQDLMTGLASGRFDFPEAQMSSVVTLITGATLGAMFQVLEGHRTWRDAGAEAAELLLVALGLPRNEAHALSRAELSPLPVLT
ncbi:MAG: TetR/AcrR family transcriptional regulator [Paucibacter sp.]|nr:TetR/AcrR family transcriptional regulator [Roseateles sp.]